MRNKAHRNLTLKGQRTTLSNTLSCNSDYWGQYRILYPSYFKLQVCWLRSFTRITYLSKLIGIHSLAAFLQLELFWVYVLMLY
ncbi:hypothetical protein Dd1591_1426 [Dickeya chrysanthemi Ech1591]|uniref:Uncharacterized protein n=1 Tax=Dickeya chrysanthemi (strain Ech1591) TaxID=561229 RepID=C6CEH9_DICC1|nr:hypothetical protein Dd1591_1426 [Dickeya chrysanthemi Ech1591]